MELAEQQREWQKEEVEEEEAALEGRRARNLAAGVSDAADASSGDEMLPFSDPVSESEEVEYGREELHYNNSNGNSKERNGVEPRKTTESGAASTASGEEMLASSAAPVGESNEVKLRKTETGGTGGEELLTSGSSGPVDEFQEEEEESRQEELRIGTETISGYSVTDNSGVRGSASEKLFGDDGLVATLTKVESQRDDNFTGFGLQPSEKSSEEHRTNKSLTDITESHDEIQLIEEIDNELTEFDVERVLEKQDTHDLYCPNCNSCITRRVILRKRKRKIRISVDDPKRYKLETVVASELDGISVHATKAADISLAGSMEPAADEYDHVREPEVFRCLSCFSFFIPSGEGFTLFKIFGDKSGKEKMQSPQPIPVVKKNWLFSIFASRKEEMLSEQGSGGKMYVEENIVAASKQEVASPLLSFGAQGLVQISTDKHQNSGVSIVPSSAQGPKLVGEPIAVDIIKKGAEGAAFDNLDFGRVHQLDSSSSLNEMLWGKGSDHLATQLAGRTPVQTEEPAENDVHKPQLGGLKIPVHSSPESLTQDKPGKDEKLILAMERNTAGAAVEDSKLQKPVPVLGGSDITGKGNILPDFPAEKRQNVGATLPISSVVEARNVEIKISLNAIPGTAYPSEVSQHSINGTKVDIHKEETLKSDKAHKGALSLPVQDAQLLQDTQANITKDPAKSSASPDIIITIEGPVEPTGSQEAQDIITSPETVPLIRPQNAEAGGSRGVEIIKSIVYGGLLESITSLGIVSSAAGGDASTLNILALGLANLVGGLFVIGHHLWTLKDDHPMETSDQVTTQKNRYQELLGRRQNFWLHATVAILSFLIFGLVPPVVYGFTFRVSDNVDYKLIAVAGASLLCIIILAIGKVYVQSQRTPKAYLKTITYYVVIGFMASGVSYAVGDLIKILMAKLGWFNSTLALTFPIPGAATPVVPAWGSY
ncbi:hypothetical protein RHGRI_008796 [Rhododendron griersonianum]|uniref:Membrane protein of ER body-like protein n=1 Tax=Rhododendron griersonianum TaxID=479676 RepID=A0AAV6L2H0_9ERIC|nr:hypothetical protein RHGRI_008796 [Rhododendron griersonianum]